MHDRKPRAVIPCVDSADVLAAVAAGRDGGLDLAIRGGGHSVPGFGTVEGGLVIDLLRMTNVRVDPVKKVARVGGGATWGDVDHATYPFGLAAPGGIISTTGVGGLTLGGGIGYLTRDLGLAIDNLLAVDVVLADGRQVTASGYRSMHLHPINSAAERVDADETACGHRNKNFARVIAGIWSDPAHSKANIKWVKDYYAALHPHSGGDGGYVNFMSNDDDRADTNYGANYERLAAMKATYDPGNLFHINQNIVPANGR